MIYFSYRSYNSYIRFVESAPSLLRATTDWNCLFRLVSATSKLLRRRRKCVTDVDFYVVVGDKEPEPEQVSCRRRG